MMKAWFVVYGFVTLACYLIVSPAHADPVRYDVSFDATWSTATHPAAYPAGAHFSPLVGAAHNGGVSFWRLGGSATPGIEQMAELGSRSTLRSEFQTAIAAGTARSEILDSGIGSPGNTTTSFETTSAYPLVTLVTMIAPSPDWFVGVTGLDLRSGNVWRQEVVVDLFAYDAGTDSGLNFNSSNSDTNPREPISLLGTPFVSTPPLGTFKFTLVSIPEPSSWLLAAICAVIGIAGMLRSRRVTSPR